MTARRRLVDGIFSRLGLVDDTLRRIMLELPRHNFVDSALAEQAYLDNALPIGFGQTISQPSTVALMTYHLAPKPDDKILEIGTGSGYQTAILARYTRRLYTIERHADLQRRAREILDKLGLHNIIYKAGDGSRGWESCGPYDCIIVTAGAPVVPESLALQLAEGGRMVIPSGDRETQKLLLCEKKSGRLEQLDLGTCRFVPLVGSEGWKEG